MEAPDHYAVLGVPSSADESTIRRAYRKAALKWHPDKNPDNPAAEAKFEAISQAKEVLVDAASRREYDEKRAKEQQKQQQERAAQERRQSELKSMGAKRRRFRDDLERREQELKRQRAAQSAASRPRSDGERPMTPAEAKAAEQSAKFAADVYYSARGYGSKATSEQRALDRRTLKVKWRRSKLSHSRDTLHAMFRRFGELEAVTLTGVKGNAAEVVFRAESDARKAAEDFDGDEDADTRVTVKDDKRAGAINRWETRQEAAKARSGVAAKGASEAAAKATADDDVTSLSREDFARMEEATLAEMMAA
eukprot:scaffold1023_cov313-Pinguiococcus_pyrenoidosus.AAC.35